MRTTRSRAHVSALVTLGLSVLAASITTATFPLPNHWHDVGGAWHSGAVVADSSRVLMRSLPFGELDHRAAFAVQAGLVAVSAAASWCAFHLFRGPGRWATAVAAGVLTSLSAGLWAASEPAPPVGDLAFATLAVLTLSALIRPLVRVGRLCAPSTSRALGFASASACLDPVPGGLLAVAISGLATVHLSRSHASARTRAWWLLGGLPGLALLIAGVGGGSPPANARPALDLSVAWPPIAFLRQFVEIHLLYPALALVGLMIIPLRWRGGMTVAALLVGALVLRQGPSQLVPVPTLLACLAVAASGWIWLAGTVSRQRLLGSACAVAVAAIVLTLGVLPLRSWERERGPYPSPGRHRMAREALRALDVPGDLALLHDGELARELAHLQRYEGARPDVTIVDVTRETDARPSPGHPFWRALGQRVLSDSFDHGGAWDPAVAIEQGPLFWFLFDAELAAEHPTPSPLPDHSTWPPELRERWDRLRLEHARFRRKTGRDLDAIAALPLPSPELRSIQTAAQVARAVRLTAPGETQLATPPRWTQHSVLSASYAEAGDLLYASGERDLGASMLERAAKLGYAPAWTALIRWHLLAGHERSAQALLARLPPEAAGPTTVDVVHWLLTRHEPATAQRLLDGVADREQSPELVAARLRLLALLAEAPTSTKPGVDELD
ncbi:MAG: hypothetical protein B7733_21100 [Myxococcales bacterium FL481]|nr:MAG: hypothetical protein B7733_21100 [Myxococcales bacterium FL481]